LQRFITTIVPGLFLLPDETKGSNDCKSSEPGGAAVFDRVISKLRNFRHLSVRRTSLVIASAVLVCVVGFADYLTAYDQPVLLFYLLPISVAAWFGGLGFSLGVVVACVGAWTFSDVAGGTPFEGWWNLGMAVVAFVVFAAVLSKLATLVRELDRCVDERTTQLRHEMAERQELDRQIVEVADRERRRLGQDLHDRLGQHLIGTGLSAQALKEKLVKECAPHAADAEQLVQCLEEAIDLTRKLARGFYSSELDAEGLSDALRQLAGNVTERFQINCAFHGDDSIRIRDSAMANQFYRIAQEAVTNSIKHAGAKQIDISLATNGCEICLTIVDDGIGFSEKAESTGVGLRLMRHGAALSGASFDIRRNGKTGTVVRCQATNVPSHGHLVTPRDEL
jgi:signal transduction histidine kinase